MIARIVPGRPITTVVMSELIAMMSDSAIGSPFWPPAPPGGLPLLAGPSRPTLITIHALVSMVKWFWADFSGFSYFGVWGPLRPLSAAHFCAGGVGMRKAVGGAVGASDGLGLFSVIDARRWVVGRCG